MLDFTCPHVADAAADGEDVHCEQVIDERLLRESLRAPPALLEKLARFRAMEDKNYRECPQCAAPNTDGPSLLRRNALTCRACGQPFCFEHGGAHPGQTCRQYERQQRAAELATSAAIATHYRRCPNRTCRQPIEKSGGCNHMTCFHCRTDFCWLCGERIAPGMVGWHYSRSNLFGCSGLQMEGDYRSGMGNRTAQACVYTRRAAKLLVLSPLLALYWAYVLYVGAPCQLLRLASGALDFATWLRAVLRRLVPGMPGIRRGDPLPCHLLCLGAALAVLYYALVPALVVAFGVVPALAPDPPQPPPPPPHPHPPPSLSPSPPATSPWSSGAPRLPPSPPAAPDGDEEGGSAWPLILFILCFCGCKSSGGSGGGGRRRRGRRQ